MKHFFKKNIFVITILVVGFIIRLTSINQSLWMDEAISGYAVKNFNFVGLMENFIKSDTHPPLYYLILKFWTGFFGYTEFVLRFPSVIFGVLTILIVYKIGEIFGRKTAKYGSILTAFSPLLVYYSQEARMYALSTFLVSLVVYLFLTKKWALFSVFLLLLGMTDYLPLLILIPIWLYVILSKAYQKLSFKFFISHLPLFSFYILWFPIVNFQQNSTMAFIWETSGFGNILGVSNLKNLALVWVKFLIGRINFSPPAIYILVIFMASSIVIFPLSIAFKKIRKTLLLCLWFTVPIFISFIISLRVPGFSYFRLIFTLPAFILLISYGLSDLKIGRLIFCAFLVFEAFSVSIYLFNRNFWREDWKMAVPFIENQIKANEKVLISYKENFTPYEWYSKKRGHVQSFNDGLDISYSQVYTLDYLMDLTDPERKNYEKLVNLGFEEREIYNFRGVGQVRYWIKK